jgi:polyisoprenoid-binding protein YceI
MRRFHSLLAATALGAVAHATPAPAAELRVDPSRSTLLVRLYKDGPASAFAHDHVVRAGRFEGTVRYDPAAPAQASVSMEADATTFTADEPALRRRLGLPDMKEGTRSEVQRTMMGARQLDAARHPKVRFRSTRVEVQGPGKLRIAGELTLHGRTRPVSFPAEVRFEEGALHAKATVRFRQSEFGIEPYRFAFGAVRNRDAVEMIVELVAQ